MNIYDSHTHLNDDKLFPEREKYILNFEQAGGKGVVNIGVEPKTNARACQIASERKGSCIVKATVGFHPSQAVERIITSQNLNQHISGLQKLVSDFSQQIIGIGECGTDVHYEGGRETLDFQKELFAAQCELAIKNNLPIVIHSRDDFNSIWDVLKVFPHLPIYVHCRGFTPSEIKILKTRTSQIHVGFCGNVTYPKAQEIRDSLFVCPQEWIVLETDAPYLAPQAIRGQQNEPAHVKYTYEFCAEFLKMPLENLAQIVEKNRHTLYSL